MYNDRKVVVQQGGFGLGSLCVLATFIFGILKLAGVLNWSWWLVVAIIIILLIIVGIVVGIAALLSRN